MKRHCWRGSNYDPENVSENSEFDVNYSFQISSITIKAPTNLKAVVPVILCVRSCSCVDRLVIVNVITLELVNAVITLQEFQPTKTDK